MNNKVNTTGKPLRKTALKSIIAFVLCMATIFGSIGAGGNIASAASKKVPLTVTFKGKKVNLVTDLKTVKIGTTFSKVQKKWGKSKKTKFGSNPAYQWAKGKSSILIVDYGSKNGEIGGIVIDIEDKNASVYGVKVGMKKAQAIKKIENTTGWKVKSHTIAGEEVLCVAGKHDNYPQDDEDFYCDDSVRFYCKNKKISSILFNHL